MSDDLKPCPHCGNVSHITVTVWLANYPLPGVKVFEGRLICEDCGSAMLLNHVVDEETPNDIGKSNLRKALCNRWNARAAVTEEQFAVAVHNGEAWQKVRECHDVDESSNFFRCSQCGCEIMRCVDGWKPLYMGEVNFCPNCGAKVLPC